MFNHPIKKPSRPVHFSEEEPNQLPQPRRRRYPVLVYRDRNGNHIANDIATAPKIELPLTPIVPRSVTRPTSSPPPPHKTTFTIFDHPIKKRLHPMHFPEQEPNQRPQPRRRRRYPVLVYRDRNGKHIANDIATAPKVELPLTPIVPHSDTLPTSPILQTDPEMLEETPKERNDEYPSPQHTPRKRTTASGNAPYHVSSWSPGQPAPQGASRISTGQRAPQYTTKAVGQRSPHHSGQYVTQAVGHRAPEQSGQYVTHVIQNASQKRNVYQSPPLESAEPGTVPPPQTVGSYPSGNIPAGERIILAGKRCGTVEYWRSSLQMPREKSVVKALVPQAKFVRSPARVGVSPGHAEGNAGRVEVNPGRAEGIPGCAEMSPGSSEDEIGHEFWRSCSGGAQAGPVYAGVQSGYGQKQAAMPAGQYPGPRVPSACTEMMSDQPIAPRYGQQEIEIRSKEEIEQRRLQFLRDSEMRRLRTLAQSKFHMKMQDRGRMKLEQWVNSDPVTTAALDLIVTEFDLDRRVLSDTVDIRRNALYDMRNENLRILEALMSRISSPGGRRIWSMLTNCLS